MNHIRQAILSCLLVLAACTMFGRQTEAEGQEFHITMNEPYNMVWNVPEASASPVRLTEEEINLLGKLMVAEAEGEGDIGMMMVANVVFNRVASPEFPDTIEEVIYQKGQFACITDGRFAAAEPNELTEEILIDLQVEYIDLTNGALYFCEASSDQWHKKLSYLYQYKHHKFYRS